MIPHCKLQHEITQPILQLFDTSVGLREAPLRGRRLPRRRRGRQRHLSHQRHDVDRHESGGRLLRICRRGEGKEKESPYQLIATPNLLNFGP